VDRSRLAWLAAAVFLDMNGKTVELADDAVFELVVAVAAGDLEVDEIADRLMIS